MLDAYAEELRAKKVPRNVFVHKMRAKIKETGCLKNFGEWNKHDKNKCNKKPVVTPPKKKCSKCKKTCGYKKVQHKCTMKKGKKHCTYKKVKHCSEKCSK